MARKERRFAFRSGNSEKFWGICIDGKSLTVRFGRIGTAGQQRTKIFDDARDAERAGETLVREKTAKGYKEVQGRSARAEATRARQEPVRATRGQGSGERHDQSRATKTKPAPSKATWGPGNPAFEKHMQKYGRFREEAEAHDRALREGFGKLPARVKRKLSWDEFESEIRKQLPKVSTKRKFAKVLPGLATTPPSYAELVSRFSDIYEWRLVYKKRTWPTFFNLEKRIPQKRASMNSMYATEAPRKAARMRKLLPFASDASETSFCWDCTQVDERGEPTIYAADFKHPYDIRRLSSDLLDVIQHYRPTSILE